MKMNAGWISARLAEIDAKAHELGFECEGGMVSVEHGAGAAVTFDISFAEPANLAKAIAWKAFALGREDGQEQIKNVLRDVIGAARSDRTQ